MSHSDEHGKFEQPAAISQHFHKQSQTLSLKIFVFDYVIFVCFVL